jgi:hypothetical protein
MPHTAVPHIAFTSSPGSSPPLIAWSIHLFILILCLHLSLIFLNLFLCCFIVCNMYTLRHDIVCLKPLPLLVLCSLFIFFFHGKYIIGASSLTSEKERREDSPKEEGE